MNKIYLFLFAFILWPEQYKLFAQTTDIIPQEVKIVKNSFDTPSLSVVFELDIGEEVIDDEYWIREGAPKVFIQYAGSKVFDCPLNIKMRMGRSSVGFIVSGFSKSTFDRFLNKNVDNQISIVLNEDLRIKLLTADSPKYWVIRADVANRMMNEELVFSDSDRTDFVNVLDNMYYYENRVDFGVRPGTDSSRTDYVLSLRFQNAYHPKSFFKCGSNNKILPVYWSFDSRLSTNFEDSLNYIRYYPLNIMYEQFDRKIPYRLQAKLGHESNQNFNIRRVALDGAVDLIIPNLVNLTTAQSERLRLKPVIAAGLKGYYDYSKNMDALLSGMAYLNGHYYIPVFTHYAIIIDGGAFYDFSRQHNPGRKLQGNYSVTLGAEIPNTGFKAMFKYTDGKTDINYKQGSIVAIGLLMDFLRAAK